MESDNKFENDTGGMSVDEIIADIDRKTANAAALEENSVGITPEGQRLQRGLTGFRCGWRT